MRGVQRGFIFCARSEAGDALTLQVRELRHRQRFVGLIPNDARGRRLGLFFCGRTLHNARPSLQEARHAIGGCAAVCDAPVETTRVLRESSLPFFSFCQSYLLPFLAFWCWAGA
jgi:hypothetical protein